VTRNEEDGERPPDRSDPQQSDRPVIEKETDGAQIVFVIRLVHEESNEIQNPEDKLNNHRELEMSNRNH
jgi:hypothetical protein